MQQAWQLWGTKPVTWLNERKTLTEPKKTCTVAEQCGRQICQPCDLMPLHWNWSQKYSGITMGYHKRSKSQTQTSQTLGLNYIHPLCVVRGTHCHLYITYSFLTVYDEIKSRERERDGSYISPVYVCFPFKL